MSNLAPSQDERQFQRNMMSSFIQIAALAILVGFCLMIIGPFASVVVWGIVLAVAVYPLHLKLASGLGGREKWSATIIVLIGLVILLVPGWLITDSSLSTAQSVATEIRNDSFAISPPKDSVADWPVVGNRVYAAWSTAAANFREFLEQYRPQIRTAGEWLLRTAGSLVVGLLQFTASVIIAGFCLMYAKNGYELSCAICTRIIPDRGKYLTDLSTATIRSVTNGVLGVAVIQAVLAGVGFAMIGVPAPGLLTIVVLVTAIVQIPAILIMVPVIAWVFSFAEPVPATIFAVYSMLVALSDNVLKPLLLGRGVDLPVLVVLLGAIGGMVNFGVIGLFLGAVILGVGYQVMSSWIWAREPEHESAHDESPAGHRRRDACKD